jgi:hypothetical protein
VSSKTCFGHLRFGPPVEIPGLSSPDDSFYESRTMTALPSSPQRLFWLENLDLEFLGIRDANGIVKGVCAATKPAARYDPMEPVDRHYQDIVHAKDRNCAEQSFASAMHGTPPETVKLRNRATGGSWRTF